MKSLGISIYPDVASVNDIYAYIQKASKADFKRVFSSMFSVADTNENVIKMFTDMSAKCHECNLLMSVDVNPELFERLGVKPTDLSLFKQIGIDILRMDMSYGLDGDVEVINNKEGIQIEFNASALKPSYIKQLIEKGAKKDNILVSHNFYPQPYTGMKWEKFLRVSKEFKEVGIRVGAFVSSHAQNTHGVWDSIYGLPSVEKMRHLPIDLQVREMLATDVIDEIMIGNAFASDEEFDSIKEAISPVEPNMTYLEKLPFASFFMKQEMPQVKKVKVDLNKDITDIEKEVLLNFFPHIDMGDSSEWIWRNRIPRFFFHGQIAQRKVSQKEFVRGDVVMVNNEYEHYSSEVQVVLIPIVNDGTRNLIGHISVQEMELFELIKDMDVVVFLENA